MRPLLLYAGLFALIAALFLLFPGIDTMLSQIFNLPVKLWDPTEGLEVTATKTAGMSESNADMAIAVGLASRLRNL